MSQRYSESSHKEKQQGLKIGELTTEIESLKARLKEQYDEHPFLAKTHA